MLSFASQDINELCETNIFQTSAASAISEIKSGSKSKTIKLFADKLCIPLIDSCIERPRLTNHIEKSLAQFSAILLTGRAGTGKTALAADFARKCGCNTVWFKVENADSDWKVFASYLSTSLEKIQLGKMNDFEEFENLDICHGAELLADRFAAASEEKPLLIVLDDLHAVFDADWFVEFFTVFLPSQKSNVKLLMTSRATPPLPLWRLRSKQVLGVVDEKLLAFTTDETIEFFRCRKLSQNAARAAHKRAFGKIAKIVEIAEQKTK